MSSLGSQEIVILAIVALFIIIPISVGIGILLLIRSKGTSRPTHSAAESRLAELHHLHSQGLITSENYETEKAKALKQP